MTTTIKLLTAGLALAFLTAAASAQTFTVSGVFRYEDKSWGYNGWTGADPEGPIRKADVHVFNDGTGLVLASGSTAEDGSFSLEVATQGTIDLVCRVDADTQQAAPFQRIRVTTTSNVEYQSYSPVFPSHDTNNDLDIGTVTVLKALSGGDEANPFNLLDMGVRSWDYIKGPDIGEGNAPQTIRLYWPGGSGSFASGNDATIATDDGYDDPVILHEIGHVVHNMYSDSDSPGGSHFFGDSNQDPKLSMGEGYATAFAGHIMDQEMNRQAIYLDANGSAQNGGAQLRLRIETAVPYSTDARGAADEVAVACTLFDIIDSEDSNDQSAGTDDDTIGTGDTFSGDNRHKAWWDVFIGPIDSALNLTINHAWDGWFSVHGTGGDHPAMESLYGKLRLDNFADVDEPNNSQGTATPKAINNSWNTNRTLYYSDSTPPAPGSNDSDYYALDLVIGSRIDVETRYPGGAGDADTQCDTYLELYNPGGQLKTSDQASGTDRNALINGFTADETGTWAARVRSTNSVRRYGRYDVRFSYEFENELPNVTAGPTATPATIDDSSTSTLSVTATDAQALSYAWTPLGGGSISGSGSSVTFDPPGVVGSTDFDIQLVITDALGAETDPLVVTVTVTPGGSICGSPAQALTGGVGKPGQNGTPSLAAVNLPVVPNTDFGLQLTDGLPLTTTYLIIGFAFLDAPFDQGTMYPTPDVILALATDGNGDLFVPLPMNADPAFCGLPVWWQFMTPDDPGAAGGKETSQSNYVQSIAGN
jgi:hypothetical protein